jgi:hypothetical protein
MPKSRDLDRTEPMRVFDPEATTERRAAVPRPPRRPTSTQRPVPPPVAPEVVDDEPPTDVVDLLAPHFTGNRASLRPLFETLLSTAHALGDQVIVRPEVKAVYLQHQRDFACILDTPQGDRVYLGLVLSARPPTARLARAKDLGWGPRYTHMVLLQFRTEVDFELRNWLAEAYRKAG